MSNTHGSKWVRPEKRLAINMRDRFACAYCGRDLRHATRAEVTLDHLVPRVAGGGNEATNLVTACRACNSSRQDRPWVDFATGGAVEQMRMSNIGRIWMRSLMRWRRAPMATWRSE